MGDVATHLYGNDEVLRRLPTPFLECLLFGQPVERIVDFDRGKALAVEPEPLGRAQFGWVEPGSPVRIVPSRSSHEDSHSDREHNLKGCVTRCRTILRSPCFVVTIPARAVVPVTGRYPSGNRDKRRTVHRPVNDGYPLHSAGIWTFSANSFAKAPAGSCGPGEQIGPSFGVDPKRGVRRCQGHRGHHRGSAVLDHRGHAP
jgi:hypothetical protein